MGKKIIPAGVLLLIAALIALMAGSIFSRPAKSDPQEAMVTMPNPLQPGDYQYRHEELHPFYKMVFSSGKCSCGSGLCRPTKVAASATSPVGFKVVINRKWCDVSKDGFLTKDDKKEIPAELRVDEAHVCATLVVDPTTGCPAQECVIINDSN